MARKTKNEEIYAYMAENKAYIYQIETGLSDKFRVAVICENEQVANARVKMAYPNSVPVLVSTAKKIIAK